MFVNYLAPVDDEVGALSSAAVQSLPRNIEVRENMNSFNPCFQFCGWDVQKQ